MTTTNRFKRFLSLRRDPSRALQWGFAFLLLVCTAQAAYWVGDNLLYTRAVEARLSTLYASMDDSTLQTLMPEQTTATAAVSDLAQLSAARTNRYLWEGGFFLLVLSASIVVLVRAIRHESELRRRQQNFLAAVSHELKSPLAGIQLSAETLIHRPSVMDTQKLGHRILSDSQRLLRLVDNLLDTTRMEEGVWKLSPTTIPLKDAVMAAIARAEAKAKPHDISLRYDSEESWTVFIDSAAFAMILDNLLDNAVKSCIAANGNRVEITSRVVPGFLQLDIADDGTGFPEQEAMLLFEKFYRPGNELQRNVPGSGLGLYLVRRIIEKSGGRISATNKTESRGAIFSLRLPSGFNE